VGFLINATKTPNIISPKRKPNTSPNYIPNDSQAKNLIEKPISETIMPKPKTTWCEKLRDNKNLPKIEKVTDKMSKKWGTGTVVIPAPIEVDALMKKVPKGKLITINEIRVALAKKHGATIGCPMTTGIFAWVAANAAEEERQKGKKDITPYWRVLKSGGVINEKYPGGAEAQKILLEREGHTIIRKGKKYTVANYKKVLAKI
jgi:alkylated DNA nucleotide flippase Atl1